MGRAENRVKSKALFFCFWSPEPVNKHHAQTSSRALSGHSLSCHQPGKTPDSFDKQFVRDYLLSLNWNMKPPAPELPAEIVKKTQDKYREALRRLTA